MTTLRIPAVYMRGGTSKGVFFEGKDLPRVHAERDALLLRVIGSPDPFGRQADGMGGATSGTSKVAVVSPSRRDDCDVDYLFGAVSIGEPVIDWSGNCDELSAAVGPFAIVQGLVPAVDGITQVRIWQQSTSQRIDAWVPVRHGEVVEEGAFVEEGVPFAGAEIRMEFVEPDTAQARVLLPTGSVRDTLTVPGLGEVRATLLVAGGPAVFVRADALGLTGRESLADLQGKRKIHAMLEALRAAAAVRMGLAETAEEATRLRPSEPEIAWVARPAAYRSSAGAEIAGERIDVLARILTAGRLNPAFTGTGSIALAAAAALPGSVVGEVARTLPGVPTRIGHPSGTLTVGAELTCVDGHWRFDKAVLSRSARRLMSGWVHLPSRPPALAPRQAQGQLWA
ncbi:2-methylaconitate cis-trans isomerase PrpF [Burkholderiaceae bacterium FT117]|uniref:2-methylaconitate cis-trans isomerase PrpF family protein n=1 Tax=Zeimonas sediminis TaxID=2944268 RepID=UPI002342E85B|nr:PrpF domain-containing protein [Zeimonas sediminis]MCM5569472.1 2-methylaconitate cis-trans isomerase PrpF [Zeimonas sediminis]